MNINENKIKEMPLPMFPSTNWYMAYAIISPAITSFMFLLNMLFFYSLGVIVVFTTIKRSAQK